MEPYMAVLNRDELELKKNKKPPEQEKFQRNE